MIDEINNIDSIPLLSWIYDIYLLGNKTALSDNSKLVQTELIENIIKTFGGYSGCLVEKNTKTDDLEIVSVVGLPDHVLGTHIKFGEGILGSVAKNGAPILLEGNLSKQDEYASKIDERNAERPGSSMCWPLMIENEVTGVISINRKQGEIPFNNQDLVYGSNIIKFISLVLENARLHVKSNAYFNKQSVLSQQQAVWSEALSWLNSSHKHIGECGDLEEFYKMAILQAVLIAAGEWGCILECTANRPVKAYLSKNGVVNEELLLNIFSEVNIFEQLINQGLHYISKENLDEHSFYSKLTSLCPGYFTLARVLIEGNIAAIIIVNSGERVNDIADENFAAFSVFLDGIKQVLEHRILLMSLKRTNSELAQEKNEQKALIAELKDAQNQLLQSEKLASIGQLAAGVAHEINNPVGYISSNISSLKTYIDDIISLLDLYDESEAFIKDSPELIERINSLKEKIDINYLKEDIRDLTTESLEGVGRVKQIVQDLKDFSHVDEAEWQWADVHKGLDSTLNVVNNEIKYKADVIKEYGDLPQIECIPSQLNQVFMNMLVNAAHAIEDGRGTISIRTGTENGMAWFEFVDTGKGIEQDKISKIFDPFFTTKPVGKGTGLGLSLSYGIIEAHKGKIEVKSEIGKGTMFRITIPIKSPMADTEKIN